MISLHRCTLIETYNMETASSVANLEEGRALVSVLEGGIAKAKPSTGEANEVFLGVSVGRPTVPMVVPYFETIKVPASAPYTATLARTMNGSELGVTFVAGSTRTAGTSGGTGAGGYTVAGNTLTFNEADKGKTVELRYRYNISYQEAVYRYNFNSYGFDARTNIGTTGICSTGNMFTDCFDLASDWGGYSGATPIRLGVDGRFTLGGSGVTIDAHVLEVPSVDTPFLGLGIGLKHS